MRSVSHSLEERVTRNEGDLEQHVALDDLKHDGFSKGVEEVKRGLNDLKKEMHDGFERLTDAINGINLKLASQGGGEPPEDPPSSTHIGDTAKWIIGGIAALAIMIIGWETVYIVNNFPAIVEHANQPPKVQVIQTQR